MKRILVLVLFILFLTACSSSAEGLDSIIALRTKIMESNAVSFDALITADYLDETYTFGMHCETNDHGDLTFTVTSPETIAGISGEVSDDGSSLIFDKDILAFKTIADDRVTPVSAPWLLMKTLRSGYIKAYTDDNGGAIAIIHDSYTEDALQLNVSINENSDPVFAEILWDSRRVLSIKIDNFHFL